MPLCYGEGVLNSIIDKLPGEIHIPGYQFCGPGTKLKERLSKGQQGVNPLDGFCRKHDIAYSQSSDLQDRNKADYELEQRAWERVKSKDAKFGEKAAAWLVTTAMKAKRNLDMRIKQGGRVTKSPPPQTNSFRRGVIKKVAKVLKESPPQNTLKKSASIALKAARVAIKNVGGKNKVRVPRIIPFDHSGGFLPLLPILGALGAVGSLAGGASAIAKTIIDAKNAKKKLEEDHRHNAAMEAIGAKGSGLYLKKNQRGGFGLYLKKQQHPKKLPIKLPNRPLTDIDLKKFIKHLKISNFRGVYMRDTLPSTGPKQVENAILNLDLNKNKDYDEINCGHLCLQFLYNKNDEQ
ncbi:hypothetical protein NQ315_013308 [Exocentrus adspersus]|uniref:Phospholipase A2-like domain-containing protein n=1 Tax=Exocentrus adspersus TaxID=1586481 RepID=A0AAV8VGC5_9CUCU|nr:hypothetical protein NQ315_013308 [Exocentrus adspersus]